MDFKVPISSNTQLRGKSTAYRVVALCSNRSTPRVMKMFNCMKFLWRVSVVNVTLFVIVAVFYNYEIVLTKLPVNYKDSPELLSDLKSLAIELSETQRSLLTSSVHYHCVGKHIEFLHNVMTTSSISRHCQVLSRYSCCTGIRGKNLEGHYNTAQVKYKERSSQGAEEFLLNE